MRFMVFLKDKQRIHSMPDVRQSNDPDNEIGGDDNGNWINRRYPYFFRFTFFIFDRHGYFADQNQ